jgi:acetyl esterase/lipase
MTLVIAAVANAGAAVPDGAPRGETLDRTTAFAGYAQAATEENIVSETVTLPASGPAAHAFIGGTPEPQPRVLCARKITDAGTLLDVQDLAIPGGPVGETWLRIVRPAGAIQPLPVVMYIHSEGAGLSRRRTCRLVGKLAIDLQAAVVVVNYSLSPKARYPVAIEENYAAAAWIAERGEDQGLDGTRIVVAADAGGGGMAGELMVMAGERDGPALAAGARFSLQATALLREALAA